MQRNSSFHPVNPQSIRRSLEADARRHYPHIATTTGRRQPRRDSRPRGLRWQDRVLLVIGIVLMALLLLRIETASAQTTAAADPWGIQFTGEGQVHTSMALETVVHVEVTGMLARVLVVQSFRNDGGAWAEGVYRFPLPDGAAVDRLFVKVGDRVLEGEIQEREAANRIYQQARAAGQTTSLVEQERANQFKTSLANIAPGEDIQVMLGFIVNVNYEFGVFSLRLPTTFNRRWGSEQQPGLGATAATPVLVSAAATPGHAFDLEIELRTDLGFAAVESRYHDVNIESTGDGYRIRLADPTAQTDRDFELAWYPDLQSAPQSSLLTFDDGDSVYAQLMLVPPAEQWLDPQSREVIFIIDTSGSMEGGSLTQARSALLRGLDELDNQDHFNLVQFNSATDSLFPHSVPASAANLQQARDYLSLLNANGGTVMAPALDAALSMDEVPGLTRQVIFITDGSVGNETELLSQIAGQLGDSRLFTIGIGSAPNSWFMRKAAEIGRGDHTHIGQLDEVEERMSMLWTRIRLPAISDICIDWGIEAEYYPEIIPDMYAGSPLWVIARLPSEPLYIELCGELNGAWWSHEVKARPGLGNDTLASLWGRAKVEALQDSLVFGADPELMRLEVTEVALQYELLTPYTSLVAVDKTPVRAPGEALESSQVPSLLPAGSSSSVAGFPSTATGWKTQLALSFIVLLVAGWLFWSPGARLPVALSRRLIGVAR
jgi:Ca-activated chloride channel family protein